MFCFDFLIIILSSIFFSFSFSIILRLSNYLHDDDPDDYKYTKRRSNNDDDENFINKIMKEALKLRENGCQYVILIGK
jgi:hypothetical protein